MEQEIGLKMAKWQSLTQNANSRHGLGINKCLSVDKNRTTHPQAQIHRWEAAFKHCIFSYSPVSNEGNAASFPMLFLTGQ
jgi:hypothetical protein